MAEITKVPPLPSGHRPETGPMQFGDDWPGVFIRGDDALSDAVMIEAALKHIPIEQVGFPIRAMLEMLLVRLRSCRVDDT